MKKVTRISFLLLLLCCQLKLQAQTFTYKYAVSGFANGLKSTAKIIETYDHNYVLVGYGTDAGNNDVGIISKITKNGEVMWTEMFTEIPTGSNYLCRPTCVAEDAVNHDLAIGGYNSPNNGGAQEAFVIHLQADGTFMWDKVWAGPPVKGILFNTSTATHQIIALHSQPNLGTGFINLALSQFDAAGTLAPVNVVLNDNSIDDPVSITQSTSRSEYYIVGNRSPDGIYTIPHIIYYKISYTLSTASVVGQAVSISNNQPSFATKIVYDESFISSTATAYISGYEINKPDGTSRGERPLVISVGVSTMGAPSAYNVLTPASAMATDNIRGTGLDIVKEADNTGLILSCYHVVGTGVSYLEAATTNSSLSFSNYYQHNTATLPNAQYNDITTPADPGTAMMLGRDLNSSNNFILTRTSYKGYLGCSNSLSPSTESQSPANTSKSGGGTFSLTIVHRLSASSIGVDETTVCGCAPGKGLTLYAQAINGTFGSWNKNQTEYNKAGADVQVAATLIDGSANKIDFISIAQNGVLNFAKKYTHSSNITDEVRAIKRLSDGDYAIAGIVTVVSTPDTTQYLFVMKTAANGDVKFYKYMKPGRSASCSCTGCGCTFTNYYSYAFLHVYLAEDVVDHDIIVAADGYDPGSGTGAYHTARLTKAGTLLYYTATAPTIYSKKPPRNRYDVMLTGVTPTYDGGYVITESSGNNEYDWNAAVAVKYDNSTSKTGVPTAKYFYRRPVSSPPYALAYQNSASYSVFNDVKEDASHNLIIVGRVSNMNPAQSGESYCDGLIVKLNSTLTTSSAIVKRYHSNAAEIELSGITIMSNGNYAVTGKWGDIFGLSYGTPGIDYLSLFEIVNSSTMIGTGYFMGNSTTTKRNELNCAWQEPNGFILTGLSNDYIHGTILPSVYSVDGTGALNAGACDFPAGISPDTSANAAPGMTLPTTIYDQTALIEDDPSPTEYCQELDTFCSGRTNPPKPNILPNKYEDSKNGANLIPSNGQTIYPNPVSDKANMDVKMEDKTTAHIQVFDMQGRVVLTQTNALDKGNNHLTIDMQKLQKGIYMVKVFDEQQKLNTTVRIEKM